MFLILEVGLFCQCRLWTLVWSSLVWTWPASSSAASSWLCATMAHLVTLGGKLWQQVPCHRWSPSLSLFLSLSLSLSRWWTSLRGSNLCWTGLAQSLAL